MLDHIGIVVSDFERSKEFYQAALAPLRYRLLKQTAASAGFGVVQGYGESVDPAGDFWISRGQANLPRTHVAFGAASHAAVDDFFASAQAAGGRDNGPPGVRPQYHVNYYAAFVLDPDGYNIEVVCHSAPGGSGVDA